MSKFYALLFSFLVALPGLAQICAPGTPLTFDAEVASQLRADVPTHTMPYVDVAALEAEDAVRAQDPTKRYRFGYNMDVNLGLGNAGVWQELGKGDRLWRLRIKSPAAKSLNFQFDAFELPTGATLFLYNDDQTEVLGALTSANNKPWGTLGTTLLQGEAVTLEYYEPGDVRGEGRLNLGTVTHGYRPMTAAGTEAFGRGLNDSGNCNVNTICPDGDDWRDQIRSVAVIVVGGSESCTGAMINNTCEDETPYFLTADHCLGGNVSNWVFRFNWDSPTCTPSAAGATNQTVSGASVRASNENSDFALLELSAIPPESYDVFYAGWDRSNAPASAATAIHHPSGDVKKISFEDDALTPDNFQGVDSWEVADWDLGTTEGGSSGSPLFNPDGLIIGQLYGGTAACGNNDPDYYGRFDRSWDAIAGNSNQLEPWLDGCATAAVTLSGLGADLPTANNDASTSTIADIDERICGETVVGPSVRLRNKGAADLTSANVNWNLNNGNVTTIPWTGSLSYNQSEVIPLGAVLFDEGTHVLKVWSDSPNASIDENNANDTTTFEFTALPDGFVYSLELQTDYYGSEVTFTLEDQDGSVLEQGGPYGNSFGGTLEETEFCLAADCYTFTIYDDGGDGMTGVFWDPADGYYTLYDGDGTAFVDEPGDSYNSSQEHFFCTEGGIPDNVAELPGVKALNIYPNPSAGTLFANVSTEGSVRFQLFDLLGQPVSAARTVNGSGLVQMDMSQLANGLYLLRVESNGSERFERIVLTR